MVLNNGNNSFRLNFLKVWCQSHGKEPQSKTCVLLHKFSFSNTNSSSGKWMRMNFARKKMIEEGQASP